MGNLDIKFSKNHFIHLIISSILAAFVMSLCSFELVAMKALNHYVAGAFLQGFGLLAILFIGLDCFTGHINDIFVGKNKICIVIDVFIMMVVNLFFIVGFAHLFRLIIGNEDYYNAAIEIANYREVKIRDWDGKPWYRSLLAGIFCAAVVFTTIEFYKKANNPFVKVFIVLMGVGIYVIAGFENILTDFFYIAYANQFNPPTTFGLFIVLFGNIGGYMLSFGVKNLLIKSKQEISKE